jgi:hypothetical protein
MEDLKTVTASFRKAAGNFFNSHSIGHAFLNPLPGSGWGAGAASAMTEPGQEDATSRGALIGAGAGAALSGVPMALQMGAHGYGPGALAAIPLSALGGAIGGAHAGHHHGKKDDSEKKKEASFSKSASVVDGWAREMARADAEKIAHAQETFSIGDSAGRLMAKTALAGSVPGTGLAEKILHHVTANPGKALAVAGGVAGAAHGLLKQDGGVMDALAEGGTGAALGGAIGHAGGNIHHQMTQGGATLGEAAHGYKDMMLAKGQKHVEDLKKGWEAGKAPPANQLYDH